MMFLPHHAHCFEIKCMLYKYQWIIELLRDHYFQFSSGTLKGVLHAISNK